MCLCGGGAGGMGTRPILPPIGPNLTVVSKKKGGGGGTMRTAGQKGQWALMHYAQYKTLFQA